MTKELLGIGGMPNALQTCLVSTDWISLLIIFSNLVKSSMTDSKVVVLTVLVLGVRTGGCSPSESSGRVIRDRDRVRIGLRVTSSLFRPRFSNEGSVMSNFD